jgi:hypothetical protein
MEETYYQKNREHAIAYAKKYQKEHPEEHKRDMRKYVKEHSDKIVEYNKEYKKVQYHSKLYIKQKQILKTYHSMFVKGNKETFKENVGLSSTEFKAHVESLLEYGYDWTNYRKTWRIGRINLDLNPTDAESIAKFFNYKNVKIEKINIK